MTNAKSTKRALLMSIVALLICFTMLMGTTYAWFTDSVTSVGNKIVAGTLDVKLLMHNGTEYVDISDVANPIIGAAIFGAGTTANENTAATLWEPGKTQTVYLAIENAGSLDIKYQVALEVKDTVVNSLNEVVSYAITPDAQPGDITGWVGNGTYVGVGTNPVTTAQDVELSHGDTHYFALSVHMDEEAGNKYQNGSIEFDIKVLASQLVSESDSFGNDYDDLATYPEGGYVIKDVTVKETAATGTRVTLTNDNETFKATATVGAAGEVTATITRMNSTVAAFTAAGANGKSLISYDVDVAGHEDGTPVDVELYVGENLVNIDLYHEGNLIPSTYEDGYVKFTTYSFSPFEVAFKLAEGLPVAKVTLLNDFDEALDIAYRFSATEEVPAPEGENGDYTDEQIDAFLEKVAPYGLWHADFVVSFDKDVAEGAAVLGGQYDEWSENWMFFNTYRDFAAGERLRLLKNAVSELLNQEIYINYAELCGFVKNFNCGIGANDDSVIGTTVTVELRLYETYSEEECLEKFGYSSINEETGNSVVIATYQYTFK